MPPDISGETNLLVRRGLSLFESYARFLWKGAPADGALPAAGFDPPWSETRNHNALVVWQTADACCGQKPLIVCGSLGTFAAPPRGEAGTPCRAQFRRPRAPRARAGRDIEVFMLGPRKIGAAANVK